MEHRQLSVAILGSRGIPNRYGGFEACAEELSVRLVQRGHKVVVYTIADHPVKDSSWKGVSRVMLPDPESSLGSISQFIYDFHCNRHSRKEHFDIILHLGYTSDSVWYWLWPRKSIHIVNMDGQEWKRTKYKRPVRAFLKYAERLATFRSRWLVADSRQIENDLRSRYKVPVRYIAYGANIPISFHEEVLSALSLTANNFDLIIARMEPENNIEAAILAKIASDDRIPLLIIGNNNGYKLTLKKKYGNLDMIRFSDAIYEEGKINSLRHFSRIYIHGHSVGGTNPSLLEAMACGCRIVAHRNPFNEGVLGDKARYFSSSGELTILLNTFEEDHYKYLTERNLQMVRQEYNWDAVTDAYENLFYDAFGTE